LGKFWLTYIAIIPVFNRVKIVQLTVDKVKDISFKIFSKLIKERRIGYNKRFIRNLKALIITGGSKRL
jgi:hypothetical protein